MFSHNYVVTTPRHATEIPACALLVHNIVGFMKEVGGGAVLVTITGPRGKARYPTYKITRLNNGPALSRASGWDVPDYSDADRMPLIGVSGRLVTNAQLEADKREATQRRAASMRTTAEAKRKAAKKGARGRKRA